MYLIFTGGTTLHNGLGFLYEAGYAAMSPEKLDLFRKSYEDMQLCTVDEVSMLAPDKLYDIHRRMCEIFISQDPFADKALMFVGDLMQVGSPQKFNFNSCIRLNILFSYFSFLLLKQQKFS